MISLITIYGSIYFILIAFIFTGIKEGWRERERQVFQKEGFSKEYEKCQTKWHRMGLLQRIFMSLAIIILIIPDWYQMLAWFGVCLWFSWVGYDGWTNWPKDLNSEFASKKPNGFQRFFYSGSTKSGTGSKTDLWMAGYAPFLKFGYTLILIALLIAYISLET